MFDRDRLRKLLAFLDNPEGDGLFLIGPTGCGKTSLVVQAAARLHWPVQMVPVHGRLELDDMLGQKVLDNGCTPFLYGALSIAVRDGHILILDEMDVADPAELAGLYDLLDRCASRIGAERRRDYSSASTVSVCRHRQQRRSRRWQWVVSGSVATVVSLVRPV